MAIYTTYSQVGKAEDVSDIISNISPFSTPMQAMLKTEKVTARTYSWLEDSLAAISVNAAIEGADAAFATLGDATERTGTCQILVKGFQVSETSDAIKTHGRAKETALTTTYSDFLKLAA